MNFTGIFFALFTVFAIGIGFVWVIKLEFYIGAHVAKVVGASGVFIVLSTLLLADFTLAAVIGIIGGTITWGATELSDQAERVRDGMFPTNPRKQAQKAVEPPTIGNKEGGQL